MLLIVGAAILLKEGRGDHEHRAAVRRGAVVVDAVEFMLAYDNEISGFQSVHLILHHVFGVSFQKKEDLIVIVVMELEVCVGGGSGKGLAYGVAGFHSKIPLFS